ncbi:MAG: threonine--tRNA ligase [Candidatus Bipolaricaulota bacterium]
MATVEFPNGELIEAQDASGLEVAREREADVLAMEVDGQVRDLRDPIPATGNVRLLSAEDPAALEVLRHSAAHVLAHAVRRLFPRVKLAIGPAIRDGFYYDFEFSEAPGVEDLQRIEQEMQKIVKEDLPIERVWLPREDAEQTLRQEEESYKQELLGDMEQQEVCFYCQGEFADLCRGPHIPSTGAVRHFKLMDMAGAYWRGDANRTMLTRIYGTVFPTHEGLKEHVRRLEEARRRDHRILGPQLELFSINNEDIGAGLVLWHPKGARVRQELEDFWVKEHYGHGYQLVRSPHIGRARLWERSGHLEFYREGMYAPLNVEGQEFYLKPMNCPFHIAIYKAKTHSWRELPLRYAELGTVYRFERSGVLHGLLRVRGFTQDDAHIICRPDQVEKEIRSTLRFALYMLRTVGFSEFAVYLSTRPAKYVGEPEQWELATKALRRAVEAEGMPYEVKEGDGAFYGPKIDIDVEDSLGRAWQLTTIQFDFNEPERFGMSYTGEDGYLHRPYMIHRALYGAMERFFGILIEHFGGAFPVWLAPIQAVVLPVSEEQIPYSEGIVAQLSAEGLRAESWGRAGKTLRWLIRQAQLQKVPYMLVVGPREAEEAMVALRLRTGEDLGPQRVEDIATRIRESCQSRTTEL